MNPEVAIIGDGAMGTLCAIMLAENGHCVRLWSAFRADADELTKNRENRRFLPGHQFPDLIEVTGDDAEALRSVKLAVSAVPTQYMRGVWSRLSEHCPKNLAICSVAKGIEVDTLLRPTQILTNVLGDDKSVAVLSGPSIAPEVAERLPATVAVASQDDELARKIQTLINRPYFRIYTNPDMIGVEISGATKNVIAIAAGILDGLKAGYNAKAALLTRGLAEITRLGVAMGARKETFAGLAGVGDLVTTCTCPMGRNRTFGQAVGQGKTVAEALADTDSVVEGVATTAGVIKLAGSLGVEMPITRAIHSVLEGEKSPAEAIDQLMTRPLKAE